jgi:LmbE family N-acetylglucosaminyl deacetylase
MVVHAHPDDEAGQTGGTLARYAAAGCRTVLVTCTDGRLGDTPAGSKPGAPDHRPSEVAALRSAELATAAAALGISEVVELGHPDSGLPADPNAVAPGAFSRLDAEPIVDRLTGLMRRYQPDVVITYPPNGLSYHPDHIRTHEVTVAAFERFRESGGHSEAAATRSGPEPKLYFIAVSLTRIQAVRARGLALLEPGSWIPPLEIGIEDSLVSTVIDVSGVWEQKVAALAAHASQGDAAALHALFSVADAADQVEEYMLARPGRTGEAIESDLFAGIHGI